jgi:hypothetical protein
MGSFVIDGEEMRRAEIPKERNRDTEDACCSFSPALTVCLLCSCNHINLVSGLVGSVFIVKGLFNQ